MLLISIFINHKLKIDLFVSNYSHCINDATHGGAIHLDEILDGEVMSKVQDGPFYVDSDKMSSLHSLIPFNDPLITKHPPPNKTEKLVRSVFDSVLPTAMLREDVPEIRKRHELNSYLGIIQSLVSSLYDRIRVIRNRFHEYSDSLGRLSENRKKLMEFISDTGYDTTSLMPNKLTWEIVQNPEDFLKALDVHKMKVWQKRGGINTTNYQTKCDYAKCQMKEEMFVLQTFWALRSNVAHITICESCMSALKSDIEYAVLDNTDFDQLFSPGKKSIFPIPLFTNVQDTPKESEENESDLDIFDYVPMSDSSESESD